MEKTLSLVIPNMYSIICQGSAKQWHYLQLLLARSKGRDLIHGSFKYVLQLMGLQHQDAIAAIKLQHAGFSVEDRWVCIVDLVNMQPNRDHVSVVESQFNDLTSEEARILERDLNQYFEEDGFTFFKLSENDWVCMLPQEMNLPTVSASNIKGQNIIDFIPEWRTNSSFRKCFSDSQMVLHHSQANQLRSNAGKMEINSIWLHKPGRLPENIRPSVDFVVTDDQAIEAIADFSSIKLLKQFNSWDEIFAKNGKNNLIYCSAYQMQKLIKPEIFELLFEQLKSGKIEHLDLVFDEKTVYSIIPQDLKKFWKRRFDLKRLSKI